MRPGREISAGNVSDTGDRNRRLDFQKDEPAADRFLRFGLQYCGCKAIRKTDWQNAIV